MKKLIVVSLLTSAMMAPVVASAAATAELKLIGTITPSACVPNFVGGSTIDYGNIASSTLNSTAQTMLPEKTTSLTITCDAPIKFGFGTIDERRATAITTLETLPGWPAEGKFGLGAADDGTKIGAYSLKISNETSDTGATGRLASDDGGATWDNSFQGMLSTTRIIAFSDSATGTAPAAHKSISVDVQVVAAVDKTANLPITDDIEIDGLATFEVKYL